MDSSDKIEQLFLLEVLIDKVVLTDLPPDTPIRLRVKFIEFPCFEITQQDFKKDEEPESDGTNFNSGKSFLFPMVPLELIRNLQRHPLAVTVFQIKEDAPLLPEIVGQTRVRMSEGMSEAVFSAMSCNCDNELPISHTLTDTFSLRNMGRDVGTIALFIRLSCFGQSIVTQFQLMGEKKAFLFKNSKADNSFQCKKPAKENAGAEEPTKYDVLPVAPFLTSEDNCFDMYSPSGDPADTTVAWKITPPKPAPCPVCETRPGCNPPPKCPPAQKPCPNKAPVPPCSKCGSKKPTNGYSDDSYPPAQKPCPNKAPVPPCSKCGSKKPTNGNSDDSYPREAPFVCPVCGTKVPPKKQTKVCSICSTSRPRNDQTKKCSVCGTGCPFSVKPEECSVCGAACPFKDNNWSACDPCPPNNYPLATETCPTPCTCPCEDEEDDIRPSSPPVRYDTTGALSPAFMGWGPGGTSADDCTCDEPTQESYPPVRYDTTGALSPAFVGWGPGGTSADDCTCDEPTQESYPPIRYDTTGALSPAFMGWGPSGNSADDCTCDEPTKESYPPVRYDTTGALSPAFMGCGSSGDAPPPPNNPPVRYDTTGALSPAFMGAPPEPSPLCKCGGEEDNTDTGSYSNHNSGQGDGVGSPNAGFFASSPVWQTGSNPDVMQSSNLEDDMREKSHSDERIGKEGKRKKRRTKWTHKWGLQYPGIKFGHRNCCEALRQVPPQMGWLWNNPAFGHKYIKGWRPGAVGYTISKMINQHREASGRPPIGAKAKSKWKSGRGGFGGRNNGPQPPTLHIHRREGAYYISMHPLDLGPDAVNVPLQFKIPKREREEGDDSSSSSEESELEIEFMAPGAFEEKVPPPEFKNFGTQYNDEDCTPKEKEPSALQLGKKGGSAKGGKKGKKGKVIIETPQIDSNVLELFKSVKKTLSGRKPTGFVKGPPVLDDDEDDEPSKGVIWEADPSTAVDKDKDKVRKKKNVGIRW